MAIAVAVLVVAAAANLTEHTHDPMSHFFCEVALFFGCPGGDNHLDVEAKFVGLK